MFIVDVFESLLKSEPKVDTLENPLKVIKEKSQSDIESKHLCWKLCLFIVLFWDVCFMPVIFVANKIKWLSNWQKKKHEA